MKIRSIVFLSLLLTGGMFAVAADQFAVLKASDLPAMSDSRLVIAKSERKLEVFDGEMLIKTYKIALGSTPIGDKEVEGDGKTPEGEFYIHTKNTKSSFYLSLGLSYPDVEDAERGLEKELISQEEHDEIVNAIKKREIPPQKTALGGEIFIHGHGSLIDWTAGCVALANSDVKELFDALPVGTKVSINP